VTPEEKKKLRDAAVQAGGITLFALGGVTVFKEMHILEHGDFHFDSLVHTQLTGGETRTEVHDRGVDLTCNSLWTIKTFFPGSSGGIAPDKLQPLDHGHEGPGPALVSRVQTLAKDLQKQAPQGEVLVLGTTDPAEFRDRNGPANNATLAFERATQVKSLLVQDLGGQPARSVTVANDKMGGFDPKNDGLARMMFGGSEISDRSALVCVLEPRAPGAVVISTNTPVQGTGLFLAGAISTLVVVVIIAVLGLALWSRRKEQAGAGKP
jgi:hypothetical protein